MNLRFALFALLVGTASACGDTEPANAEPKAETKPAAKKAEAKKAEAKKPEEKKPEAKPAAAVSADGVLKADAEGVVRLEATDTMQYNAKRIEVEGTKVKIELKHVGKMDKKMMGHNVVILKPGTDAMKWSAKAISAAATDYIPADDPDMIAHSKLVGGGESDTIEFDVPGPGEYPFVCSFPGHSGMMKGVLVVK
ncbi:MAG TPA: azurin [Deltaproteobacteria bacterium]|nr:azurin [Deltaproteobacteria bacterium]